MITKFPELLVFNPFLFCLIKIKKLRRDTLPRVKRVDANTLEYIQIHIPGWVLIYDMSYLVAGMVRNIRLKKPSPPDTLRNAR